MSKGMLGAVSVKEVRGVVSDMMEKCSGRDGRKWLVAAKRFLRREDPWPRPWRVAFESDLGAFLDLDQIFEHVGRFGVSDDAKRAIHGPGTSFRMGRGNLGSPVGRVRFVELTPRDLGFRDIVAADRLIAKAAESGLAPCPPEVALHLPNCLAVDIDRPLHVMSHAVVVTARIDDGSRHTWPHRFVVTAKDGAVWLNALIKPEYLPDDRLLFALPDFETRWRVKLGELKETELLERLLRMCSPGHFSIDQGALVLLDPRDGFAVADEPTKVELVTTSVGELGFLAQATYEQVIERAEAFGLEPCSDEVFPALALQEDGRFPADYGSSAARYHVATDPDNGCWPNLFVLEDRAMKILRAELHFFRPDDVFVFVKPRKGAVEE